MPSMAIDVNPILGQHTHSPFHPLHGPRHLDFKVQVTDRTDIHKMHGLLGCAAGRLCARNQHHASVGTDGPLLEAMNARCLKSQLIAAEFVILACWTAHSRRGALGRLDLLRLHACTTWHMRICAMKKACILLEGWSTYKPERMAKHQRHELLPCTRSKRAYNAKK